MRGGDIGAGLARHWRLASVLAIGATLAACGGGGGGDDGTGGATPQVVEPPALAAALSHGEAGAVEAVDAAVAAAQQVATAQVALFPVDFFLLGPSTGRAAAAAAATDGVVHASQTDSGTCYEVFGTKPCAGSVHLSTNFDFDTVDTPAGGVATFDFDGISTIDLDTVLMLDGKVQIEFVTRLEDDRSRWTRETMLISLAGFRGRLGNLSFGPLDRAIRVDIDASAGTMTTTVEGVRYAQVGVSATPGGTSLWGGNVRLAHPSQPDRFVDVAIDSWMIYEGHPIAGQVTVSAGGADSARVEVLTGSTSSVTYAVRMQRDGIAVADYRVLGTYVGGVPSYAVVPD